jgi:RNA polymerase sigma-70 factor (family 1)
LGQLRPNSISTASRLMALQHSSQAPDVRIQTPGSDAELAMRIRTGSYEAFTVLFRTHYTSLVAFARGFVGSEDEAEEIVQDVFVRVWDRRHDWRLESSIRGYLFGATRNRAMNAVRRRRAEWRWETACVLEPDRVGLGRGPPQPDQSMRVAELDAAVRRAISRLPEQCRIAYTLRWHHELTYAEIAHALGISIKTVESHISKALKALRKQLAQYK